MSSSYERMTALFRKNEFDKLNESIRTNASEMSLQQHFDADQREFNELNMIFSDGDIKYKKKSKDHRLGHRLKWFTTAMILLLSVYILLTNTEVAKDLIPDKPAEPTEPLKPDEQPKTDDKVPDEGKSDETPKPYEKKEEPPKDEPAPAEEPKGDEPKPDEQKKEEPAADEPKPAEEPPKEEPKAEEPAPEEKPAEDAPKEEPKLEEPAPSEES